jgi:hypothetical protein
MAQKIATYFFTGVIVYSLSVVCGYAQPGGGGPGGGGEPVPISGIEILLAAGGLLGIKKFLHYRKHKHK